MKSNNPQQTHVFEQVTAHLLEAAGALAAYANALQKQGFSREEAMHLVSMAARVLLDPNRAREE